MFKRKFNNNKIYSERKKTQRAFPKHNFIWLWLSLLIVLFDRVTKIVTNEYLVLNDPTPIFPYFNLTLVHNQGAAFGMLQSAGGWQHLLFIGMALVVSMVIVIWLNRLSRSKKMVALALALVLGGALGNLIDRIFFGYVVDFLDIHLRGWHWPAFNVADIAICLGAFGLIWDMFRQDKLIKKRRNI